MKFLSPLKFLSPAVSAAASDLSLSLYIYIYLYLYKQSYMYVCVYIYIYIYIYESLSLSIHSNSAAALDRRQHQGVDLGAAQLYHIFNIWYSLFIGIYLIIGINYHLIYLIYGTDVT